MIKLINPAEQVSGSEKMNTESEPNKAEQLKRSCVDCHTTRTPLWRGGPSGPRSLCNACGIRYRKQRIALQGLGQGRGEKNKKKMKRRSSGSSEIVSVKIRLMGLGRDMVLQKRELGEEEEAAILLMALSSGSVYA